MAMPANAATLKGKTVVDPDTTNNWTQYTRPGGSPSTQNVGRIWTDKSVFNEGYTFTNDSGAGLNGQSIQQGDSDFLVSLSALSSTSNLKEMVQTGKPLDIVLVFDMSGSMDETFGQGWNQQTRINALKNAANSFINATAEANDAISDPNLKHQISLVKFAGNKSDEVGNDKYYEGYWPFGNNYNYSQVVSDLAVYDTNNVSQLTGLVNALDPAGGTQTDYGMEFAQEELNDHGRDDAQQVVIFFTDGEPGDGYSFDTSIANSTVSTAYELKQAGALVYSVGIFTGASSTSMNSQANQFMQAVSSNYPNATAYNNRGERGEGDYYKTASDADELNAIFEDIFDETQEDAASGSPIEENTQQGNTQPGTLTFEDQLGNYMQVTGTGVGADKIQLAYGDQIYTSTSKTTDGNTDTYHFSGTVDGNEVYGQADLSAITVTVERSNDLATGDKVTVTLPASLLPMRHYDVDTDNNTMTVSQAYPVRLFYGVSLKADAEKALNDPSSDDYAAIVASQKSADGKTVDFYSNNYAAGAANGSTTATFSPNAGNKFYYYTQDTTLYIDQNCTTEADQWNIGRANTLYWKDTYWVQTSNGGAEERSTGVAVNRGTAEWNAMQSTGGYQGHYYIPANTPRSDRPATMTSGKTDNATGTAANALNPAWVGGDVTQYLGNNGKLSFDMPGSLEIKKTVDWGNASDQTKQDKNSFTFTVDLTDEDGTALTGEYPYYLNGSDEQAGTVTNNGTITINGGQSVKIEGLPAGAQFTVEEQGANTNGFTTTDDSTAEGNENTTDGSVSGTIVGGGNVSTTFTNTYKAADVNLSTNTTLKVKKDLQDRDWRATDEFTFEIDGLGNTAGSGITTPEPADTTITVNSRTADYTASFGDITFTAPGEYRYKITEDNDTDPIAGIDYSGAIYRVVVTVTDNGTGNLEVSNVAIEQRTNDNGEANNPVVEVQGDTVTFVNKYDADGGTTNIDGTKSYTDTTGDNSINADKFTFKIEALGGYDTGNPQTEPYTYGVDEVPLPVGSDEGTHSKTVYNTGYGFTFGTIAYSGDDINRTYEYKVTELAQNKDGQAEAGMTYDTKEYTVKVAVTEVTDADGTHIVATPDIAPEDLVFTNTYDPDDVTLGENGVAPIQGTKTLDGRDMKDGETFSFQLTQTGGPGVDGGGFVTVLDQPETVTVAKDNMQNGSADFNFGNLTFSQVGTYTFTVNEVADEQGTETADGSGMTYDTNIATVTVKVSDSHDGNLKAEVTYSNDKHADTTDKALFANTYEASMNYGAEGEGGINVTKQMLDRPMNAGDFSFTITGEGDAADLTTDADKSFQNTAAAADQTITMAKLQNLTFDEADAGKTFTFIVDEEDPAEGQGLAGVTYDKSQFKVEIEVVDNGNGTMHAVTTVTQIMDKDGDEIADGGDIIVDSVNSDADDYTVPTFGFVNDYNPTPATVGEDASHQIQVTKKVEGADSATNYTFKLTATGDNVGNIEGLDENHQLTVSTDGTIKAGESQTKTFGDLKFTAPGAYTFTVQEIQPGEDAGWTFDDADGNGVTDTHTVTVVVTDLNENNQYDGNLYIDSVTGSPVEITNSYEADPVIVGGDSVQQQITVQKTVTGHDTDADFSFQLEPADFDPSNDESKAHWSTVDVVDEDYDGVTTIVDNFTDRESHTATFGGIQFSAAGEFQFNITEVEAHDETADPAGWTYDTDTAKVTVKVTDNGEGQLVAEVVYGDKGADINGDSTNDVAQFTNTYRASGSLDGDADGNLTVTKNYTSNLGDPWTPDDSFGFWLEADMSDQATKTAMDNGWIALPDNAGTTDAAGITITDTDTHQASFNDITFTEDGTYKFIVHEILPEGVSADSPTKDGITYDTSAKTVTVNVVDNSNGTLTASVDEDSDELTFNNSYNVQPVMYRAAFFKLEGNKVLDGRIWEQGDTFTFTMTPGVGETLEGAEISSGDVAQTMPAKKTDTIEPLANDGSWVSDNSAQFTFTSDRMVGGSTVPEDQFTFTEPGIYRYLIQETNPNQSQPGSGILGVTYDQTTYRLEVKVVDKGDGTLEVESHSYSKRAPGENDFTPIADSSAVTFTNKYNTESIGVTFNAAKVLEGRNTPMTDNEFQFHMEFAGWKTNDAFDADPSSTEGWQTEGDVAAAAPAAAANANNIIRGDVTFADVTFTKDHVGNTYRYAITEIIPDDATNEAYAGVTYGQATAEQKAASGWTKDGIAYDASMKYVTASVTSEQIQNSGTYTEAVRVKTGGEASLADPNVPEDQTGTFTGGAIFTNTYDAGDTTTGTGSADTPLTKVLKGKAWNGDEFTFQIAKVSFDGDTSEEALNKMPMPANAANGQLTVSQKTGTNEEGDDFATFTFDDFTFDTAGTYVYEVTEIEGDNAGIAYDTANKTVVTITVTDKNDGTMTAGVSITNNVFTNEYASELDFVAAGGLEIVKTFENADMQEFAFKVTPDDQESADKLGIDFAGETFTTKPGATIGDDNASHFEVMVLDAATERMFTQDDADNTYTYTVEEVPGTDASVTYDVTKYTVAITTADDGQGGIKVTTTVTNGAGYSQSYVYDNDAATEDPTAVVPFTNTYKATGELGGNGAVSINATKTLTNRPMVDGEFKFNVTNAAAGEGARPVATGANSANGTITFSAISYSIDQMLEDADNNLCVPDVVDGKDTFTYTYQVTEDTTSLDEGVAATDAAGFQIEVTVTDNGDGTLGIAVAYPDGADGLTFRNTYGEGQTGQATININGVKGYKTNGLAGAPDINGKFTFKLTGVDENGNPAPMPAKTTATNDRGNVDFGDITYTMENVFGDTGSQDVATNAEDAEGGIATQSAERTKTFTYTVTESGFVPGVDNDPNSTDTFTVTVTDHGDGSLSVETSPNQEHGLALFGFTNEYNVDPATSSPTVDGSLTITKNLTGRDLAEGEFTVVMTDANDAQVSQGVNDASGNIALDAITFDKPGDYVYDLYEASGSKGGVTYDTARYTATADVTDNGDGTMSVTWDFANAADEAIDAITFNNTYEAAPTSVILGGSKVLDGRELAANEFQFQLADKDGNVLQTVANAANGGFSFDSITYDQAGTYEYAISEVKGNAEGVTYDETTYAVKVVVTDGGEGKLNVTELTYNGKAELPVFANSYTEPAAPIVADEPEEVLPQTGDTLPTLLAGVAAVAVVALAVLGFAAFKLRRGKNTHRMK